MPTPTSTATRTSSLDRLEGELGALLRRIRGGLADRARTTHPDISVPGYLILQKLHQGGPRRSADLVEEFGIDKGAISRQVQQLVDLGLVSRTADPDDGRAHVLSISAAGVDRMESTHDGRRALLEQRLGEWTDADLEDFVVRLARYNASIGPSLAD